MENMIAYHCGPALAGIKPANIATFYKEKIPNIHDEIKRLNKELNCKDIYFETICECKRRVVVMVYRSKVLEAYLKNAEIQQFLDGYGYPEKAELSQYIDYLKKRLTCDDFPHEIGAFLGYPVHDIYGFINHRDEGCLFTGEWKVYKDAEAAKKLFNRYSSCRCALLKRITAGKTLAQVFCAA